MAMQRKLRGNDSLEEADAQVILANLMRWAGKKAEAREHDTAITAIRKKRLGDEHRDIASAMNNLSIVLLVQNKLDEAEQTTRELGHAAETGRRWPP